MLQNFFVNPLKDVSINIFAININGKLGFRAIVHNPVLSHPGGKNENAKNYVIHDRSSIYELINCVFRRYVGASRGTKHIVATINTEPPGWLQFIQEKNQLAECYSLSSMETRDLIQQLKIMFNIK